jgi:hypothetical protein
MKNELQKKFKEVVFLYKLWFNYNKSKLSGIRLPKNSDHLYIDGFPRSGNSYAVYFLKNFYPNLDFSHHLHTIAGIKIAIKKGLNPIILIRNPIDTVASHSIMKSYYSKGSLSDNSLIVNISETYINYYQFVYNNLEKLTILPFTKIRNLEALAVFFINNISNIDKRYSVDELDAFHEKFIKMQSAKPSDRTSMPNDERNSKKELVKERILKLESYKKANSLYLKIVLESESK